MNPTVIVLQHVPHEGAARIETLAARRGLPVRTVRLFAGEAPPASLNDAELLIVMGGFMGVNDRDDPRFPFLGAEIELLRRALSEQRPVLGVCLGAQLLAFASGAAVYRNTVVDAQSGAVTPAPEVGWGPVRILERGREAAVAGLREEEMVLHWHGDTFDLPSGAVLLASSNRCKNQMFRLHRAFGIQFHVELEAEAVGTWLQADADFVRAALGEHGAAHIQADTRAHMAAHRVAGDRLIDNILSVMAG